VQAQDQHAVAAAKLELGSVVPVPVRPDQRLSPRRQRPSGSTLDIDDDHLGGGVPNVNVLLAGLELCRELVAVDVDLERLRIRGRG
jgi:hypothetical protein